MVVRVFVYLWVLLLLPLDVSVRCTAKKPDPELADPLPVNDCDTQKNVVNGDGCCPKGANSLQDDDCLPQCGNGVLEAGEICDGNDCPALCDDSNSCTINTVIGARATCDARCEFSSINQCIDDDQCCGPSCQFYNDNDCLRPIKSAVSKNGILEIAGKKIFPLGFWTGHPWFANSAITGDIDYLQNRPQGDFKKPFNIVFINIGEIEANSFKPTFSPSITPEISPLEFDYENEKGHWDVGQWSTKRLLGEGNDFPDISVFAGFPYLHEFNQGQKIAAASLYDLLERYRQSERVSGWYSYDEAYSQAQIDWADAWIDYKNQLIKNIGSMPNKIWGPVHYGLRFFAPQEPYGPAKANFHHYLYMVDIYNVRHVGDITHKAVELAGNRSPIIWLAAHQEQEQIFLEYCFWSAIVHGAKGVIWFPSDGGVEATMNTPSPSQGILYDALTKFSKTLGERLETLIATFKETHVQTAILEQIDTTASFVPLNVIRTQDARDDAKYYAENDVGQPYQSSLAYDLNGKLFKTRDNEWHAVVVNDGNDEFSETNSGIASFKMTNFPHQQGDNWQVELMDGNAKGHFKLSQSINETIGTIDFEIEIYLNMRGYRIFRLNKN